uniref:Sulfotransferase domain-containing protein n=1 Tax=viral metagenome TaxID=1070528 RepID=A0A6C0I835_9ZZZZ
MPYFLNENINLLFIHIPKTGGSSLERYFSEHFNITLNNDSLFDINSKFKEIKIHTTLQHMTYNDIIKNNDYFKIKKKGLKILSVVRNPYKRIVSDMFFHKKIQKDSSKEFVNSILMDFINKNYDNHTQPQYLFITDHNKKLIPGIQILHTETLKTDMFNIGYKDFNIFVNCNTNKVNYMNYLNEKSIHMINEYYDYDFKLFGYDKIT